MIELRWVIGSTPVLQYRLTVAVDASGAFCPGVPGEWRDVPSEIILQPAKPKHGSTSARDDEALELLRSARAIAARRGSDTAWERFDASIAALGIGAVTARAYRTLPSDAELDREGQKP